MITFSHFYRSTHKALKGTEIAYYVLMCRQETTHSLARHSTELHRRQPRETVFWSTSDAHSWGSGRHQRIDGDRTHNPFNLQHYNLSAISLYLYGQQQYAVEALQPNFGDGLYVRIYNIFFAGTCKLNRDEKNFISRKEYENGYVPYAFDLNAGLAADDHLNQEKHGSVRLAIKFSEALPHTVSVIAYAEFDNIIETDRDRNLLLDFGV